MDGDFCSKVNKFGKGLGNAARYRIVEALLKGEKSVGELVRIVKISQPAASQHLKTLKECDLVMDRRRGQEVLYSLNTSHMLALLKYLSKTVEKPAGNRAR